MSRSRTAEDDEPEIGRLRSWAKKIDRAVLPIFGPAQITRDEIEREPDPVLEARHAQIQADFEVHTTPDGHRYLTTRD